MSEQVAMDFKQETLNRAGWTPVAFGDVVRVSKVRSKDPEADGYERVVGLEHLEPGDLRIRRWADISEGTTFTSVFKPGQVLFGKRRAYQRKVAVADFAGVCSGDIYVLELSSDALLPELLPFICQTDAFFEHAVGTSAGSLSPRTNWQSLASFEFMLPPIKEQARLVEALVATNQTISEVEKSAEKLSVVKESLFEKFISNAQKDGRIKTLDQVCQLITDGTHQSPKFKDEGVPFLLVKSISGGSVDWGKTKFVDQETYDELTRRNKPKRGDVIYTAVGSYGVSVSVDFDQPFVFQRHIAHLVPKKELLDGHYLSLFLNSRHGRRQADAAAIGSAQATITLESLKRFWCPCPPLSDQREQLLEVNKIEVGLKKSSRRLVQLMGFRRAIMGAIFDEL